MAHSDSWSSLPDSQSGHRSSNLLCATKGLNDEYRDTQMLLVVKIDKQDNQSWSSNGMPRGQLWVCGGTGRHASLRSWSLRGWGFESPQAHKPLRLLDMKPRILPRVSWLFQQAVILGAWRNGSAIDC